MNLRLGILALVLLILTPLGASADPRSPAEPTDEVDVADVIPALQPLTFLVGSWEPTEAPKGSTGGCEFYPSVDGHLIVRSNYADYPATDKEPGHFHDDMMVIFVEREEVHADYYDNEGKVIRYTVSVPDSHHAVFLSAPSDAEPKFRLSYTLSDDGGELDGLFEICPPGSPNLYQTYLSWKMRKIGEPET